MTLYHGSNCLVQTPILIPNLRALDFGAGFYLTTNEKQAAKWAQLVTRRRRKGIATLNIYKLEKDKLSNLNILEFDRANEDWLDFVVKNRKEFPFTNPYDLVIGPIANDSTLPVIDDYMDGKYTKKEAVERLLPQNLADQYAFLSTRALELLSFQRGDLV